MANIEPVDLYSGTTRTLTLHARNANNVAVDLTGKTITWVVGRAPRNPNCDQPIITKSGTATVAASGIFTVDLTSDDTADLEGEYRHQATTMDGSGNKSVVTVGPLYVRPDIATG